MITRINESKTLTKHMSCECKCKLDGTKCNSNQQWNNDICQCQCKKHHISEKDYVRNPATCNCENGKYLASIMDDSVITCEEIIEPYIEKINFNEKKGICKIQNFYILLAFSFHYYGIINSCQYLLLFDKVLRKTFVTISQHK